MSGDNEQALRLYQEAAAMDYEPAQRSVASLMNEQRLRAAPDEAIARFPQAPPGVIRAVVEGYIPQGAIRKLVDVVPVRFKAAQPPLWAALVFDNYKTSVSAVVQVYTAKASGSYLDGYEGTCSLSSQTAEPEARLQSVPFTGGDHLMVTVPGETVVCGYKGEYVTAVFRSKDSVILASGGLKVGGQLWSFVPQTSEYYLASKAETLLSLVDEVRATGAAFETTEAVDADVTVTGKPAQVLAWEERMMQGQARGFMIAVKAKGEPAVIQPVGEKLLYLSPYDVGQVSVPGHTFLAVATHQVGAPNGGDVLVLEFDKATGRFREVFHGGSDAAGFGEKYVTTTFKAYRPQGGFDLYTTTYTWDETKGTFVAGKAEKSTE